MQIKRKKGKAYQGGEEMKVFKRVIILGFIAAFLMSEATLLIAQERYSTIVGKVVGVHRGFKKWLDVENEKDKVIINFRIGHSTVYIPQRYPLVGERVKVEFQINRGVHVAYTVTLLEGKK